MKRAKGLEGLTNLFVDDVRVFLILFCRDPHLLEGREVGQDGASDPGRVLSFWRGVDLDLDVLEGDLFHLVEQSVAKACEPHKTGTEPKRRVSQLEHSRQMDGTVQGTGKDEE
jgi:hypothetical protein